MGGPRSLTTGAWLDYARRHLRLPSEVRVAGGGWDDAEVSPLGYSRGCGDSPEGIRVTWCF